MEKIKREPKNYEVINGKRCYLAVSAKHTELGVESIIHHQPRKRITKKYTRIDTKSLQNRPVSFPVETESSKKDFEMKKALRKIEKRAELKEKYDNRIQEMLRLGLSFIEALAQIQREDKVEIKIDSKVFSNTNF